MAGSSELPGFMDHSQDSCASGDDLLSPTPPPGQCLKRTVSQESGLSTLSGVSYQPPERTSTPTQSLSLRSPDDGGDHARSPLEGLHGNNRGGGGPYRQIAGDDVRVAIMKGRLDTIKELYLAGIDVNSILGGGWTALMYSCSYGEDKITKFLLDNGADALYHKDMFTALMAACASRRDCESRLLSCVQHLVAAGADVNSCERHQMTPLMFACRENRPTIVAFLLNCGVDINYKDSRHWTSLCVAAYAGHTGIVSQLLQAGADPNIVTLKGHTAFDIAEVNGKKFVADLLRAVTKVPPPAPRSPAPSQRLATVVEEPLTRDKGKGTTLAGNEISLTHNHVVNSSNNLSSNQISSANSDYANQDLYLFLSGLDLLNYLPQLRAHQVDFHTLLLLEESDLDRVGITEVGARKKLLAAILEVHKQPWTKDSLPKLADNNLNCHDVQDMLANLTSHMAYMRTSLAFILRQLKKDDTVLTKGVQATGGVDAIIQEHKLLMSANELIRVECVELQRHLEAVSGYPQYSVVSYGRVPDRNDQRFATLIAVVLASVGAVTAAAFLFPKKPIL